MSDDASQGLTIQPLAYRSKEQPLAPTVSCPRCRTPMEQGVTFTASHSAVVGRALWVAGQTRRNWLGRLVVPKGKCYEVVSYRCPQCGYVESYCPPG